MLVVAVTCVLFPMARALWVLDVIACFQGMAFTVIQCVTNTLLAWTHGEDTLGPWLNLVNAAFGVGGVLAPSLVSCLGMPSYRWVAGCSVVVGAACLLTESPADPAGATAATTASGGLLDAEEVVYHELARKKAEEGGEGCDGSTGQTVERAVPWPIVGAVLSLGFFTVGLTCALGNWLYTYAVQIGFSKAAGNDLNIAFWAAFTATRLVVAAVAVVASPAWILTLTQPMAVLACTGLLLHPEPSVTLLWCFTLLTSVGVSCGFANAIALLSKYSPINGTINGLICLAAGCGAMLVPPLIGWFLGLGRQSFAAGLFGVACLNLAMLPVILALGKCNQDAATAQGPSR